jgi:hypothetical protein
MALDNAVFISEFSQWLIHYPCEKSSPHRNEKCQKANASFQNFFK